MDPSIAWSRGSLEGREVRWDTVWSQAVALCVCVCVSSSAVSDPVLCCLPGFGSMLRALGAQIEKTTNREACRDLSGRRLRDVNHEKE